MSELKTILSKFVGIRDYHYHAVGRLIITEGIKHLIVKVECFWLMDVIGSAQLIKQIKDIPFQLWEITVNEDLSVIVTMREKSDAPVVIEEKISETDFPLKSFQLYFTDNVLMLPAEYEIVYPKNRQSH